MFKFELSEQMLMVIGKALGAQPYDLVVKVVDELQRQVDAQTKNTASVTSEKKKK